MAPRLRACKARLPVKIAGCTGTQLARDSTEIMQIDEKRATGRYYTRGNPFLSTPFRAWAATLNLNQQTVLEPFAGDNSIPRLIREAQLQCRDWALFDIEPAAPAVQQRDTLADFPTGFDVCITNPPWLARNSATRRGLPFPSDTQHDDIYKYALEKCLTHCKWVAAIIPEAFIRNGLFLHRLRDFVSLVPRKQQVRAYKARLPGNGEGRAYKARLPGDGGKAAPLVPQKQQVRACKARLPGDVEGRACKARLPEDGGKAAPFVPQKQQVRAYKARLPVDVEGRACKARLPVDVEGRACKARLPEDGGKAAPFMFADTEHPVGLALFGPALQVGALSVKIWRNNQFLGELEELRSHLPLPSRNREIVFNEPTGNVGLIAVDNTVSASIRFCPPAELEGYPVRYQGRSITKLNVPWQVDVAELNAHLANIREKTHDVFLTAFKGLRRDGQYRRRLDWALARAIVDAAQPETSALFNIGH